MPGGAGVGQADGVPVTVRADAAVERIALDDGSWADVSRGWLDDDAELLDDLLRDVAWSTSRLFRYDHWVEERRLSAGWHAPRPLPHPALGEAQRALQRAYHVRFDGFGILQYRDGNDGQAFHRDTDMRWLDDINELDEDDDWK